MLSPYLDQPRLVGGGHHAVARVHCNGRHLVFVFGLLADVKSDEAVVLGFVLVHSEASQVVLKGAFSPFHRLFSYFFEVAHFEELDVA